MKKIFILSILLLIGINTISVGQAKKPTIMVVPSDVWCVKNGYTMEFDNQGTKVTIPNYKAAFQNNTDLLAAISKINEMMASRGFPLKNMESAIKSLESESAEDAMMTSKSGGNVSESPIDKLKKVAKADIWMQLTWTVNTVGPKRSLTFTLQGIDAYTDKQIAGASGTGAQTFTAELPVLIEEAVLSHIDNFNGQLQTHFDDMFQNGREVTLRIKKWETFDGDLESEYDGEELGKIIENWISDNTVQHRFSTTDATENMMYFEQVRIPLMDENNRPLDTRSWAGNLRKMLKTKYQIESKLMMKGLGQASLTIGEK